MTHGQAADAVTAALTHSPVSHEAVMRPPARHSNLLVPLFWAALTFDGDDVAALDGVQGAQARVDGAMLQSAVTAGRH